MTLNIIFMLSSSLFVSVNGESLGMVMYQNTSYVVEIYNKTDTPFLRAIKNIIHPMIALHQSDRPSIDEVVEKLSRLMDSPDRILVIDSVNKSVWTRDDDWQKISDVPTECPQYNMFYCRVSDGIVVIGGADLCEPFSAQCHHFSMSKKQWRRMQDLQSARRWAAAVLLGEDAVFVFGGESEDDDGGEPIAISACEKLNIQANTWTSIRDLPEPLSHPLITDINDKAYIIPEEYNITSENRLKLVEYDPTHDRYSVQSQIPETVKATYEAHLIGLVDQLYLFQTKPEENGIHQYDLSNGQWSNIVVSDTPSLYSYFGETRSGKLMWCSGEAVHEYDRLNHRWSTVDYKLPCDHLWSYGFVTIIKAKGY